MPNLFKGEKTSLFWAGLLLLGFTFVILFSAIWNVHNYTDTFFDTESGSAVQVGLSFNLYIKLILPWIVGGIIFILISLYMMKSGVKRE